MLTFTVLIYMRSFKGIKIISTIYIGFYIVNNNFNFSDINLLIELVDLHIKTVVSTHHIFQFSAFLYFWIHKCLNVITEISIRLGQQYHLYFNLHQNSLELDLRSFTNPRIMFLIIFVKVLYIWTTIIYL